jgi:hypothetical protein
MSYSIYPTYLPWIVSMSHWVPERVGELLPAAALGAVKGMQLVTASKYKE